MTPENLRFGGGVAGTILNPVVVIILILAGVFIFALPQRKAIAPFLLACILIPNDQILVIAGLHFPVWRILIFLGMIRIFVIKGRGKWNVFSGGLNKVDKSLILLSAVSGVAGVLLFRNTQAFIFQLGEIYTALGTYFLLRCLIRDQEDVVRAIRIFAVIVVVLSGIMIFEHFTGWNPYALLGGARAGYFASDLGRDGRVRATASFGTPILAGFFGAALFPLFLGLWLRDKKQHGVAALGMLGATVMTLTSNSSTPAIGFLAALVGFCMWPIRGTLRMVRWGIVLSLVALQMVMKAPVYHLITRLDISGSSYHRYALIDQCVRHFWTWWLVGTNANVNWGWDMWDTADQYVQTAYNGGLLGLILLIVIIVCGFKYVGRARKEAIDRKQTLFLWALGVALFTHTISFFGISLWDQSRVEWYALLAFIGAVAVPRKILAAEPQLGTAFTPEIAAVPDIRPAYASAGNPRLLGRGSAHNSRQVPAGRPHAREF